jgi:penicillin-binding protein 1A
VAALVWMMRLVLYGTLFAVCAFYGMLEQAFPLLPRIEHSSSFSRYVGGIYARDGHTLLRRLRGPDSRHYVRAHDIPAVLAHAVVAAEDRRFYQHGGLDPQGIARAAWADLRTGHIVEGGSTLTQQLVKNAYVGPQRSFGRKSREALLALALDAKWSKQRILTAYLNTAYFGDGAYGAADASRVWFGTHVQRLNLAQAALLAGMLRAPELDNPLVSPMRAHARRSEVLDQMQKAGYATAAEVRAAQLTPLPTAEAVQGRLARSAAELAPHFDDAVVGQLVARFGAAQALGGGLRVTTTLDVRVQRALAAAAHRIDGTGLSTAMVAVDARDGEVRGLELGGPAAHGAFDVVTAGHRQPGSAFKPFTLAAAFEHGYTPSTRVLSAPFDGTIAGVRWKVHDDEGGYAGVEHLDRATWHSDNTVYARVASTIGLQSVIDSARAAGITSDIDPVPATVLGGLPEGVTPLELALAYATFANHGTLVQPAGSAPRILTRVAAPGQGSLLSAASNGDDQGGGSGYPREIADLVTATLEGVVTHGTATNADIGRPAAGKTGTTEHEVDAWFVGYTPSPDLVIAVWVGHPDGDIPMSADFHGGPVMGGTFPALEWADAMRALSAGRPVKQFSLLKPRYTPVLVDPATGNLTTVWCQGVLHELVLTSVLPTLHPSDTCTSVPRPGAKRTGSGDNVASSGGGQRPSATGSPTDTTTSPTDTTGTGTTVTTATSTATPTSTDQGTGAFQ